MMKTGAELRRANVRILIAMVIFALLLATACFLWMGAKVRAQHARAPVGMRQAICLTPLV